MLFSIYIPMYNAENYISNAIESVLNQTYKDFELVIINDGSTDKSLDIAKHYQNEDSRIKIIDKENEGLFHTRIVAFNNVVGEYVIGLDADDLLKSNALYTLKTIIDQYKDLDLIMYRYERFNEENKKNVSKVVFDHIKLFNEKNMNLLYSKVLESDSVNSMCFKAIRRECLMHNEHISKLPSITVAEDRIHFLNILPYIKNAFYSSKVLYEYRYNSYSMSNKFDSSVFEGNKIVYDEMKRACDFLGYRNSVSIINKYYTIKIAKLISFAPNQIHFNRKQIQNYKKMLKKIYNDTFTMNIIRITEVPKIYRVPLLLLKNKLYNTLLIFKLICEKARYLYDIKKMK